MPILNIPDEVWSETGLSQREALTELACRLFDAGRLTLWSAARLAGLDRGAIEDALLQRKIPIYRPSPEDLEEELTNLDRLGA